MVRGLPDPVHDRIAQVDVARRHVDLRAQGLRAFLELARAHAAEQVQVLRDGAIAVRALAARLRQGATVLGHLLRGEIVHVGLAPLDQLHGPLIELLEVVARVVEVLAPVVAQPAHGVDDRVDVLLALLDGVGIVEAQVAAAAELLGHAEVDRDRLGVADVQITVRLGRKARDHVAAEAPAGVVLDDDVPDEVTGFLARSVGHPDECNASAALIPPAIMSTPAPGELERRRERPPPGPRPQQRESSVIVRLSAPVAGSYSKSFPGHWNLGGETRSPTAVALSGGY